MTNRIEASSYVCARTAPITGRHRSDPRLRAAVEALEMRRLLSGAQYWPLEDADTASDIPRDADGTLADHLVHEYDRANDQHWIADYSGDDGGLGRGDLDYLDGFLQTQGYRGLGDLLHSLGDPKEFFQQLDETELGNGPDSVFGPDNRTQITATTAFPWRTIGRVHSGGSGAMISPYHVLTAGHVVHSGVSGSNFFSDLQVSLGQADANNRPYGTADWTWVRSYTNWTNGADWNHDWAVITLDRNIGNFTGWMGKEWNGSTGHYNGTTVNVSGYPGDKPLGTQWFSSGPIGTSTTNHFYYNGTMDTMPGHSGSPVWRYDGTNRYIVGVHAYGDGGDGYNKAVRMTQNRFNDINSWIATDNGVRVPTDRPDLLDYDDWFATSFSSVTPSSISQGSGFSSSFRLRNNGTANSAASVVRFYASTNNIISTGDTLLGSVNVGSVGALGHSTITFNGAIPAALATGTYYIGWIIDATGTNTEYLENNNTGFHNSTITVTAGAQADYFEANNTLATATNFRTLTDRNHPGLSIHNSTDADYYRFTAGASGTLTVDLSFLHSQGDVDMLLLDAVGNVLASSTSTSNAELINWAVTRGTTYHVHVYGFNGATNPSYTLNLDGPDMTPDAWETNNTFATARYLGPVGGLTANNFLNVHAPDNDDYYRFVAEASGNMTINLGFIHADGDVDMAIYDGDGVYIAGSFGVGNTESITVPISVAQEFVLHVYGFSDAVSWRYDLQILAPEDVTPPSATDGSFQYLTQQSLDVVFSEHVGLSIDPSDLLLLNLTTNAFIPAAQMAAAFNAATNTARFTFPGLPNGTLPDGNYRATLLRSGVTDTAGNVLTADLTREFFFLNGDANRDRTVNLSDFAILRTNFGQSPRTFAQGDFNYDTLVDLGDFAILRSRFGMTLTPPGGRGFFNGDDGGDGDDLPDLLL